MYFIAMKMPEGLTNIIEFARGALGIDDTARKIGQHLLSQEIDAIQLEHYLAQFERPQNELGTVALDAANQLQEETDQRELVNA